MAVDRQLSRAKAAASLPPTQRVDQPVRPDLFTGSASDNFFGVVLAVPGGFADERLFVEVGILNLASDFETSGGFNFRRDTEGNVDLVPAFCMPGLRGKHYEAIRWKGNTTAFNPDMTVRRLFTVEGVLFIEHDYWEDLEGDLDEAFLVPDDCQLPLIGTA